MIARWLLGAALALAGRESAAFDAHLTAGLAVSVEEVREPVSVDGVSMQLRRITGKDVPALVRRFDAFWRSQGSETRSMQHGIWTLRSRMHGAKVEVLQWSNSGVPEMLWSLLDTGALQSVPEAEVALPAQCRWGRSVSGSAAQRRYVQRSARCMLSMSELSARLQQELPLQGWLVRSASQRGLLIERQGDEALISLSQVPKDPATWLVWLHVQGSR